jgi:quercetin dioxygenase-like cupin family protein
MTVTMTTPQTAETLWVVQDRLRFYGGIEGSPLQLIEVEVPPGSGTPPHTHASPEVFWVLEGEVTFRHFGPDGVRTMTGGAGTSVRVDGLEPHNYANEGAAPARMLVLLEPQMTAFFRDIGRPNPPAAGAAPDFAAIGAAMARHGIAPVPVPA